MRPRHLNAEFAKVAEHGFASFVSAGSAISALKIQWFLDARDRGGSLLTHSFGRRFTLAAP
jgi:hypothetical protein